MIDTKLLRQKILDLAIRGKLVPQDKSEEPASVLLERIRNEKAELVKQGKIKISKQESFIYKNPSDNRHYEKVGAEVKDITDEINFDLPEGWEYIRLCAVCWLDDTKPISGEKLPYLDARTLRGRAEKTYLNNGKVVEPGTKIILVDGENSGEVFDVPFRGYMGSTFRILGACKSFHLQYLNVILDYFRNTFKGNKTGAAIPHLNKTLFNSLIIGLPPFSEQKRIVAAIDNLFEILTQIDKEQAELSNLAALTKSKILDLAMRGKLVSQDPSDEPARELLNRISTSHKPHYEKLVDLPYNLPQKWGTAILLDISTTITSKPYQILQSEIKPRGKYPVISQSANFIEGFSNDESKIVRANKTLIVFGDHTRNVKLIDFPFVVGADGVKIIKPNEVITSCFLYYAIKESVGKIRNLGYARHFGLLQRCVFSIPPLKEQERIVEKIDELFQQVDLLNN